MFRIASLLACVFLFQGHALAADEPSPMSVDGDAMEASDRPIKSRAPGVQLSDNGHVYARSEIDTRRRRNRSGRVTHRLGKQGGPGEIDKEAVLRVLRRRTRSIRHCYERALRTHRKLQGKLGLSFVVVTSGRVASVDIESNTIGAQVAHCATAKLKGWRFPRTKHGKVSFDAVWTFRP
jgi:hypothetical protein